MAISSVNDLLAAPKQRAVLTKTVARAAVAATPFSLMDIAGSPGAGVLAGTNTASGVKPTDNDAGYPTLLPFPAGTTGAVSRLAFANSVACRLSLYDRLFLAGAYAFNADVTLANQPDFSDRLNAPFKNTELWVEWVTASTGVPVVTITYTNELGVAGRTTGAVSLGSAQTVGRCTQLPLQAGDMGISKIERVQCATATAGTFNVMVLRSLLADGVRVRSVNDGDTFDFIRTGLVQLLNDSTALYLMCTPDGTSTGNPSMTVEIAAG